MALARQASPASRVAPPPARGRASPTALTNAGGASVSSGSRMESLLVSLLGLDELAQPCSGREPSPRSSVGA